MKYTAILAWVLSAAGAFAQNPQELLDKAPPDIDEALRARVTKFYQAHVDNKFRAADAYVAEDTKDEFYGMEKQHCSSFAIGTVKYSDNFTRAQVMIVCDTQMLMPMVGRMPVKLPVVSQWKVEGGQWFWYLEPRETREIKTPFGTYKPQPPGQTPAAPTSSAAIGGKFVDLKDLTKLVTTNKTEVRFSPAQPGSDRIVITNGLPGGITLSLESGASTGVSYKLDRTSVGGGERATLTVSYEPVQGVLPSASAARLTVSPTEQSITINVAFSGAAPPPARAN